MQRRLVPVIEVTFLHENGEMMTSNTNLQHLFSSETGVVLFAKPLDIREEFVVAEGAWLFTVDAPVMAYGYGSTPEEAGVELAEQVVALVQHIHTQPLVGEADIEEHGLVFQNYGAVLKGLT